MPQADVQAADGTLLYSQEQTAAVTEWLERKQEAKIQKLLDERFAPVEKDRQEAQKVVEQQRMWGQAIERQKGVLIEARSSWPHFAELEAGIKADLGKNPTMTLETAYRRAFIPRTQADRDSMRRDIIAEMNNAKPVAGATRPGPGPAVKAQSQSMEDIIMAHAQALEKANR